ncbi:MAG: cupredoxin domain-containing protein [Thermoproteota archaeon]|nr:cupredoxin domain-containing protein [Thermoproteota archaeon]
MFTLAFVISIFPSAYGQQINEVSIVSDASKLNDKAYEPNPLTINQGDTIKWTNKNFGIYTVTENKGLFGSEDLRPNQTFEHTFDSRGIFDYHCKVYPAMTEKIIVN